MTATTGTERTVTRHSLPAAAANLMLSMGIPALIAIAGIALLGWGAISWAGALVWGVVATVAFTLFMMMGKAMGMTEMDLLDLLGSMFVEPHTSASRVLGALIHHMNGALLGVAWAYGAALVGWPANWASGIAWGVLLWVLALLMLTSIGAVHPAIRRGQVREPGGAATNFGKMTPVGSLLGHVVYGLVLGWLYQTWPLT